MNNYMIYPLKTMRITQDYNGPSHKPFSTGIPTNYPFDDAGKSTNKDPIYCPCDEMEITNIKGYKNNTITNTIWLVSTTDVITPTFTGKVFMTLTHMDDEDLEKLEIGQRIRRNQIICYEGSNVDVPNHIHITVGEGYSKDWSKNSNGVWAIDGNHKKPEEIFYIDPDFTTIISSLGIKFKTAPIFRSEELDESKKQLKIVVDNLNIREKPSINSHSLGHINPGIYTYTDIIENEQYIWYKIGEYFVAYDDKWIEILNKPRHIFTSSKSKYYLIYLKKGKQLYIK